MGSTVQKLPPKQEPQEFTLNDKEIMEIRDQAEKEDQQLASIINSKNSKLFFIQDNGKYTGEVSQNKKEGIGEYISYIDDSEIQNKKIKDYYLGQWKNDMRDGYGLMVINNGNQYDYYVGEFQLNKRHGKGYIQYSNKQKYEGQFENDVFHGKGKFTLEDQVSYYDGEWTQNERNGFGKESGLDKNKKWEYQGQFSKGKRQGKGKLIIEDQNEIEGEFENNFPKKVAIIYKQQEFMDYKYEGNLIINENQEAIFQGMGKLIIKDYTMEGEFEQHRYQEKEIQAK